MKNNLFFLLIALCFGICRAAVGDLWDAKAGWSDLSNPNTPWSYRTVDGALLAATTSGGGGSPGGWSIDGTTTVPNMYDNQWGVVHDVDEFGGHGPWLLRWESPVDGWIQASGSMLQMFEVTRRMKAILSHNGSSFGGGLVPEDALGNTLVAHPSGNPNVAGPNPRDGLLSFGPYILRVAAGDRIDFSTVGAGPAEGGNGAATFVIAALRIEQIEHPGWWDVKIEWSDTDNPNLPWSYHDINSDLLQWSPSGTRGGGPPGWSANGDPNLTPTLFDDPFVIPFEPQEFCGHGPWLIRWSSPIDGYVKMDGSMLQLFEPTRRMQYGILKNGSLLEMGLIPEDAGGNTILGRDGMIPIGPVYCSIATGDSIDLAAIGEGGSTPTFAVAKFRIEEVDESEVPLPPAQIAGDINRDRMVNFDDLLLLAAVWLRTDCITPRWCEGSDINESTKVDLADFSFISANWLKNINILRNLGYAVVSPHGPWDGADFGPYTYATRTSGLQEAFDFGAAHNKDVFIIGGGAVHGVSGPVVYIVDEPIYVPPAENWRVTGGDNVIVFTYSTGDFLVFDSMKNCEFKSGLLVGPTMDTDAVLMKVRPTVPRPDGQIGMSNCEFLINAYVGGGDVWGTGVDGKGIALLLDGSQGPIEYNQFITLEINACNIGFLLEAGEIRHNTIFSPFNHITNNPLIVNVGSYNTIDTHLDCNGTELPGIGATIAGGEQNIYKLLFGGHFAPGSALIFGPAARDNLVYAMNLRTDGADTTNNALTATNRIEPYKAQGYAMGTPVLPASGIDLENRLSHTVVALIENAGTVSDWTLTDGNGISHTITGSLRKGQVIYLEPGEKIRFSYTAAPAWNWRVLK